MFIGMFIIFFCHPARSCTQRRCGIQIIKYKIMKNKDIRKIVKNGRGSYYINIPIDILRELGWKERQKLVVKKRGKGLVIVDWKK